MARISRDVGVDRERVWEVLADPRLYAAWVVGATDVRGVEGTWPEVGARLHHTQGLVLDDVTEVVECEAPARLRLRAHARPLLVADVRIELAATATGCRVTVAESIVGGLAGPVPQRLLDPALLLRNRATLARIAHLAAIGPPRPDAR